MHAIVWKYIEHTHLWCERKEANNILDYLEFNLNQFNTSEYTTKEVKHLWTLYNLYTMYSYRIHTLYSTRYTPDKVRESKSFEVCFFSISSFYCCYSHPTLIYKNLYLKIIPIVEEYFFYVVCGDGFFFKWNSHKDITFMLLDFYMIQFFALRKKT